MDLERSDGTVKPLALHAKPNEQRICHDGITFDELAHIRDVLRVRR